MGRPLLIGSRIKNSEAIGGTPAGGFSASWRRILKIFVFDTTLRDGTQGESVSFSVQDKLTVARKLDELGVDYIEGGWPMSNLATRSSLKRLVNSRLGMQVEARIAQNLFDAALILTGAFLERIHIAAVPVSVGQQTYRTTIVTLTRTINHQTVLQSRTASSPANVMGRSASPRRRFGLGPAWTRRADNRG